MAINSEVQVCNLAIGHFGTAEATIDSLITPTTTLETIFARWFDVARQSWLKRVIPNFSQHRVSIAANSSSDKSDFTYSYNLPSQCLKVLGIGEIQEKVNNYTVEGNKIYTNDEYKDGLPVRYVKDVTDFSEWGSDSIMAFSYYLAAKTCNEVTQNYNITNFLEQKAAMEMVAVSGMNAQENMPIRISNSKYRQSRYSGFPTRYNKK